MSHETHPLPTSFFFLNQVFCNLDGVQCGAFFIWSPTIQNVSPFSLLRSLRIRPTYTGSFPARNNGIGYSFSAGLSINTSPSPLANASRASSMETGRSVFYPDTFRVGTKSGYTNASCADFNVGMHNLACFVVHLHLFFGISVSVNTSI